MKTARELSTLLQEELDEQRKRPYHDLSKYVLENKVEAYEIETDGRIYEIEIQYFWDDKPNEDIRVMGNINEQGTLSVYKPLTSDFIMAPDGNFVGE